MQDWRLAWMLPAATTHGVPHPPRAPAVGPPLLTAPGHYLARCRNRYLLRLALIHSSAAPTTHNAIMAWLGDAALYVVVAEQVAASLGNMAIGKLR